MVKRHTTRGHYFIACVFALFNLLTLILAAPATASVKNDKDPSPYELARLHPGWIYLHGNRKFKEVALTFDDGPDLNATPSLLAILKHEHIHATFFVTGKQALRYPQIVKRIRDEGHEVGNHSFDHKNFKKLPLTRTHGEVESTDAVLRRILGYKPNLFRPPYGNINETQLQDIVQHDGYKVIGWDVDSVDWRAKNPNSVIQTVLKQVHPGSIILEHTIGSEGASKNATVQSLPTIIDSLRKQGYSFVTVSQLLNLELD